MIEPILKAQLERDEGRHLKAYRDTSTLVDGGFWTIGVGHLLGGGPRMSSITDQECDALLAGDIEVAVNALNRVFGIIALSALNPARMRAMVNMAFNRGEGRMRTSTTITPAIKVALHYRQADPEFYPAWAEVSKAIKASPWAAQIKGRADRLAKQFETGVDQ